MKEPKQILIWRADLRNTQGQKCRTGKIVAQLAHASMKAILDLGKIVRTHPHENDQKLIIDVTPDFYPDLHSWLTGSFTKVAVVVNSEQELVDIYNKAQSLKIPCSLIEDNGWTEFGGVKTKTAAAIGPANAELLDTLTGHLKLL
jgi:PTH2 family peptidyl-tRNA hydrolase